MGIRFLWIVAVSCSETQRKIGQFFRRTGQDFSTSADLPADDEAESQSQIETDETPSLTDTESTTTSSACERQCCSNISTHHPLEVDNSKKSQSYCSKRHGVQKSHSRTIQTGWYKIHPWISVCTSK